jgi:hypothetical protein
MKLSDFILLNEEQKKNSLMHDGVLIGKRDLEDYMVFLFQFENYYVESYCNKQTRSIYEFRAFMDLESLHPYLDRILLDDLLN